MLTVLEDEDIGSTTTWENPEEKTGAPQCSTENLKETAKPVKKSGLNFGRGRRRYMTFCLKCAGKRTARGLKSKERFYKVFV